MKAFLRSIQVAGALIVLVGTIAGFGLEIKQLVDQRSVTLSDLLLLFIYLEVLGMVTSYWGSQRVRLLFPMFIALTAVSRLIILQKKDIDPSTLLYEAGAILLIAIAIGIVRFRKSRLLGIDDEKDDL